MADIGYDPVDFDRVLARVKAGGHVPEGLAEIGSESERKALWYEGERLRRAARDLYPALDPPLRPGAVLIRHGRPRKQTLPRRR